MYEVEYKLPLGFIAYVLTLEFAIRKVTPRNLITGIKKCEKSLFNTNDTTVMKQNEINQSQVTFG